MKTPKIKTLILLDLDAKNPQRFYLHIFLLMKMLTFFTLVISVINIMMIIRLWNFYRVVLVIINVYMSPLSV